MKRFAGIEDSLGLSAICDFFRKKKTDFVQKNLFPVEEKMVSQSYRAWKAPFGCFEYVFWVFHGNVLGIFEKNFEP